MTTGTPVFQFGTSRFLQAHADLFLSEAGGPDFRISVIASSGSAKGKARLAALARGYEVRIRGLEDGKPVERAVRVTSIARSYDAQTDWLALVNDFAREAEYVISNTSETGYFLPEGYRLELPAVPASPPEWFPAKLLILLHAAFMAGRPGLVILPTELVGKNGDTLKSIILRLAGVAQAEDDFLDWLSGSCVFANSLVDRIVSEPLEPAGAIAEPYALWAVERQPGLRMPCEHECIKIVDDLEPYERLKIHILNLGHTILAERWLRGGGDPAMTVRLMLQSGTVKNELCDIYRDEVIPGFAARNMEAQASDYVNVTLERFQNPFLNHHLRDIAVGHEAKIERRILGFVDWCGQGLALPRLRALIAKHDA